MTLMEKLLRKMSGHRALGLDKEIRKGYQAEHLLKNELFYEVVENLRDRIRAEWESSPIRDIEGQQYLKLMLKAINDIVNNIEQIYSTGQMAKQQQEIEEKKKKRK
jgi:hypothetical protein